MSNTLGPSARVIANATTPAAAKASGAGQSNTEAGIELRRHRRARAAWPARLLNRSGSIINALVCDVSEGGVGLLVAGSVPLGTLMSVTLSVPIPREPGRTLAVRADVCVRFSSFVGTQCRIGVQFIALPMPARLAIRSYVIANS